MPLLNLELPENSIFNQFIPKNQFYRHGDFNQADKNLFIKNVERITLYSQLTRENSNIDKYKDDMRTYEEVSVFLVELKSKDKIERVAKLILESVPYPMMLIGKHGDQFIFYGAHKRDNKVDSNKILLEKIYQTEFLDVNSDFLKRINYKTLSKHSFYEFYNEYIEILINYNLEKRNIKNVENQERLLNEVEQLENQIIILKNQMKAEKHFNKKMEINLKIKNKKKKLKLMEE